MKLINQAKRLIFYVEKSYNKFGDNMFFLCISNGRSSTEVIKLIEGELYEIDKETIKFFDSDHIREKHKRELKAFNETYPDAFSAAIRIFDDEKEIENGLNVLYKKHLIAFKEIIKNEEFMKHLCRFEYAKGKDMERTGKSQKIYMDKYETGRILFNNFNNSIEMLLRNIRAQDKDRDGVKNGGQRYYDFMRYVLNKYNDYINKHNSKLPTINDLYKKHLSVLENAKLQKEEEERVIFEITSYEYEQAKPRDVITETDFIDVKGYQEMLDPEVSPYSFFESPDFDRYYYRFFEDAHVYIMGDCREKEDYYDWYSISERCFDGDICCPILGKGYDLINEFDNSTINIFCCNERSRDVERSIVRSTVNKAPTIVISSDIELLELYKQNYPDIKTIHHSVEEKDVSERELVEVFIKLYNDEYKKVHSK